MNKLDVNQQLKFDHIAVVARTLEEGSDYIKEVLGIDMPAGGAHPLMGTHNRLVSLGGQCFLEVIAIDPQASSPNRQRWFGLDHFDADPFLATWMLGCKDLAMELLNAHPERGSAVTVTRGALTWQLSVPEDGSMPLDGAFPTFIEWPEGAHPAAKMIDLGCRLHSLTVEHPQAEKIKQLVGHRIDQSLITVRTGTRMRITAKIDTPSGLKVLS